jgi:hypothetical protein
MMRQVWLISAIAALTFVPPSTFAADIVIASGVTVGPGESAALPVSLAQPAACCGLFIQLTSSDTSVATVSPTVCGALSFTPATLMLEQASSQFVFVNLSAPALPTEGYRNPTWMYARGV